MYQVSRLFSAAMLCFAAIAVFVSCSEQTEQPIVRDECYGQQLIINEVMANNRIGLLDEKGKLSDWVELKNISGDTISLQGYSLNDTLQLSGEQLLPGACHLVFVKGKLKLPKHHGKLQLISPRRTIVSEVTYDHLRADEALYHVADSTYAKTYQQTPGYDNTPAGFDAYNARLDEQRAASPLLIWEVMSRADKKRHNWVELRNMTDSVINLDGYELATKMSKKGGVKLPEQTVSAHGCIVIPTKLGDEETVVLMKDGKFVDAASARGTYSGISVGRKSGRKGFFYFNEQTKGLENTAPAYRFMAKAPAFSITPGVYAKDAKLSVTLDAENRPIRYTTNGARPTQGSPTLNDSLTITKSITIRAYSEGDSVTLRSKTVTGSYIMDEPHDLAVVNITINHGDMYDFNYGIYSDGPNKSPDWPHLGANYWLHRIKPAHIEFYDDKGGFSYDCDFKIFGGFSRCEAKKSFCVKFRNNLGQTPVKYDFFGDGEEMEMKDLVLRSGSQDWFRAMVRDEYFTSLMAPECPELLIQKYRPIALYINTQYFGLYYIREKIDEEFVSRKLQVSSDSVNIIMSRYLEVGSREGYDKIQRYIATKDLNETEHYKWVTDRLDVQGLIDWKLGEIYAGNSDVGNIRYVQTPDPKGDQKWHFVFYDLDASWLAYEPSATYLRCGGAAAATNTEVHNRMINNLLNKSTEFRKLFIKRLQHHMNKTFTPEHTMQLFDELITTIQPEMKRNCARWPQLSYETWQANIASFRAKFETRNEIMLKDLRRELKITDEEWQEANRPTNASQAKRQRDSLASQSAENPSQQPEHQH